MSLRVGAEDRTVNNVLDRLNDDLFAIMNDAETQRPQLNAVANAGAKVGLAIENTRISCGDSYLSPIFKEKLKDIQSMVDDLTRRKNSDDAFADFDQRVAKWIKHLSFRSDQPKVTSIEPRFIAVSRQVDAIRISFPGIFSGLDNPLFPAWLTFDGIHHFAHSPAKPNTLEFVLPLSSHALMGIDPDECCYTRATLIIPWIWKGMVYNSREAAQYKVWILTLPTNVGKVIVESTEKKIEKAFREYVLEWGQCMWLIEPKFTFEAFDGSRQTYSDSSNTNPFLRVEKQGNETYLLTVANKPDERAIQALIEKKRPKEEEKTASLYPTAPKYPGAAKK